MEGIARWLMGVIRRRTATMRHIIISSNQAVETITSLTYPGEVAMWRLDVKDFYLSGSVPELMADIKHFLKEVNNGSAIAHATQWLLDHQYVTSEDVPRCDAVFPENVELLTMNWVSTPYNVCPTATPAP